MILSALLLASFTVVGVHDGDTVTVLDASRQQTRIRVEGIDCPELHQAFGRRAKQFTSGLVYGKSVEIRGSKRDQYGRLIGRVIVNGRDLSLELARAGMAWHFVRYSSDKALAAAESQARAAKRGLWADPSPVPPWDWRKDRRRP